MQSVQAFSESPVAISSATGSLAFLNPKRVAVYRSAFVPMNMDAKSTKITANRFLHKNFRASLEVHDSSTRSPEIPIHELSETVVGVLGGGQLGRMLCEAASQLAIKVAILDPSKNCPASNLCHYHTVGSYDDSNTVEEFAKRCGVLTVEIEHVDAETLEKLEQQGVDCQPKASTIRIIQDKYLQKVHFSRHAIPLPKFVQIDDFEGAKKAGDLFGYPLMIKSRRLAYDGRGNAVAKNEDEISLAVNALGGYERGLYVEKWAPFVKELSVIVARGKDDSILCYPVVETIHRENICHIVKSPANVSWKILKLATEVAHMAVSSLEGAGVFAVELFLTADDQVLLNEVAPRPHNSGHHTIEACFTSQFEQHLRAVVGLPLGDPSMKAPAAIMYNMLGEDGGEPGFRLANQLIGRALRIPGATVHWYDKPEMRKQRKMGHITLVGPSMGILEARLQAMLAEESKDNEHAVPPRVGIIMGSDSDLPVMKDAAIILKEFNVPAEVRVISAHRTPEAMFSYASSARERGIQVIIAGAGGAAHLPGMVAALTPLPVIGVPVRASTLDGLDSLLSIVQMPKGVPVATVAINNATNAGLLAVRLLGISDIDLQARMAQYQEDRRNEVLAKDDKLEKGGWENYLNSSTDSSSGNPDNSSTKFVTFGASSSGNMTSGLGSSTNISSANNSQGPVFSSDSKYFLPAVGTVSQGTSAPSFSFSSQPSSDPNSSTSFVTSHSSSQVSSPTISFGLNASASSSDTGAVVSSSGSTSSLFGGSAVGSNSFTTPSMFSYGVSSSSSSTNAIGSTTGATASSFSFGASSAPVTTSFFSGFSSTGAIGSTGGAATIFGFGSSSPAPASQSNGASSLSNSASGVFKFGGSSSNNASSSAFGSSLQAPTSPVFDASPATGFSFGASATAPSSSSPFLFSSASASVFSSPSPTLAQPVFGNAAPVFAASSPGNNHQMIGEDSMAEDPVQTTAPSAPVFGFMSGSSTPSQPNPFQFGGQQSPSMFQASGSVEFSAGAGGGFSLGSGGEKAGRRYVKPNRNKNRKK